MGSSVVRQRMHAALARVRAALGLRTGRVPPGPDIVETPGSAPSSADGARILTVAQMRDW